MSMKIKKPTRKEVLLYGIPMLIGAAAGYAYYYYIGCASGVCPITSNPWISTAYGALLGALLVPSRRKKAAATPESIQSHE
jgi:hypothetical protein